MTTTNSHAASVAQPVGPNLTSDAYTRVAGLWFEDGGLIIRAEDTVFRVYRDMLATHSSGFAGMLAGASPELMDECPFVYLPDSAKDIECFLKAIFDFRFFRPHPAPTAFPTLSGVLRMSHKYDAEDLFKRALFQFSSAFPTSLVEWETRNYNVSWSRDGYTLPIIVVARQVAADWVIPAALYRLCQTLKEEEILDGVVVSGSAVKLDRRDQILVMKASMFLRCDATSLALEFLKPSSEPDACPKSSCTIPRMQARANAEGWRRADRGHWMPLDIWKAGNFTKRLPMVCAGCLSEMKTERQRALESIWDRLPSLCELPDWDELKKRKRAAGMTPSS